jgi:DNA-binding response OmpR family regulator
VSALTSRFEVFPLPPGDDPLRAARARRPDVVLLALSRAAPDEALRLCRTLRTDVRPLDCVGIYVRGRPPRTAEQVCDIWRADGYLAGTFDSFGLLAFAEALLRGERPVLLPPEGGEGALGRFVDRLRRATGR